MPTAVTCRSASQRLERWATATLLDAGAIVACEPHGWMLDRGDPQAQAAALRIARDDPPRGVSRSEAVAAIEEVLGAIGDTCPECSGEGEAEEMPRFR
ncbi:hypothetical protein HL667_11525 [Bradyrhizobium sp. 83012]|uniref:Uncharacterized protein n=1 Tax=Bradyrhizobium aeschynomenes TaxID=2734909 RepID=A0ABX2CBM2_9BRAD|nr:hypothetical protein [Bradyrhizobium aeschynomenes]NPU65626.1 hypothetical protein [Bradyrhizobium aeschynomenes]